LAKRGCFSTGQDWGGNEAAAKSAAYEACAGTLATSGAYPDDFRTYCKNIGQKMKVDFTLKKISSGSRSIASAECVDGLYKEINGCSHGGRTAYTNWEYT
ncbi:hypothetical protein K458DRAFT_320321, partial [Lentithecium fluviatile CBS 122367]